MWKLPALWLLFMSIQVGAENDGLWLSARKDSSNRACADVPGRMLRTPREVWKMDTGGEIRFARNVSVDGKKSLLVQSGTHLELKRWTGEPLWKQGRLGLTEVMRVDDFDADGKDEIFLRTGDRTVMLLDLATGEKLWTWHTDLSTQVNGRAFYRTDSGLRFITFPSYSLDGYCFDFSSGSTKPRLLWQRNYKGKYGAGFGPSIVLKDMDGDGRDDIVLSGKEPSVYHAVLDAESGDIKFDANIDLGGWGRPYGFLAARDLDQNGVPDVVMISCQVEEYLSVTRNTGSGLEKVWGQFIEKDWPTDNKELRPQITSLADLQGNGKVELVVGLWDQERWQTLVIDPLKGFSARRGDLEGCYFWGCHDINGDGRPEIIVTTEEKRRTSRSTTIRAIDGKTLEPVAELKDAAVFTSTDSPLSPDLYFMALRRSVVSLRTAGGVAGILVRCFEGDREAGTFLWGGKNSDIETRPLAGPGFVRADIHKNELLLATAFGEVQRFDSDLKTDGQPLACHGRISRPFVWSAGGNRELVVELAGNVVALGAPDLGTAGGLNRQRKLEGSLPELHIDSRGTNRLAVADTSDPDKPSVLIYEGTTNEQTKPVRIALPFPVYSSVGLLAFSDAGFRLLITMQTGVHTMALACYDSDGRLLWEDHSSGAHPNRPAAGDLDGDGRSEVIADDHGKLQIYDSEGKVIATQKGWPPAYNLPIIGPFGPKGETLTLRSSGIGGLALVDAAAREIWRTKGPLSRYWKSLGAMGQTDGSGKWMYGILAEDGQFECLDTSTGKLRWSVDLSCPPNETSIVAGDVTGSGRHEFLVGLSDGRLVLLGERESQGAIIWQKQFGSAVANPVLCDIDGNGYAEIILSTADGCVRILKEQ